MRRVIAQLNQIIEEQRDELKRLRLVVELRKERYRPDLNKLRGEGQARAHEIAVRVIKESSSGAVPLRTIVSQVKQAYDFYQENTIKRCLRALAQSGLLVRLGTKEQLYTLPSSSGNNSASP